MKDKEYTYKYFLNDDRFLFCFLNKSLNEYRKEVACISKEALDAFNEAEKIMCKTVSFETNNIAQSEVEQEFLLLDQRIKQEIRKKRIRMLQRISASVAACFILFFSVINFDVFFKESDFVARINNELKIENVDFSNLDDILLYQNGVLKKKIRSSSLAYIDFDAPGTNKETINKLIVPYGKRAQIRLIDGTKVWINAGSVVYFPSEFKDNKRDFFVDGEIFLEVTPDKQKPFVVQTREMIVKVLGTSFNVCSYSNRKEKSVLLVTGKVNVDYENTINQLAPNECFEVCNSETSIKHVNPTDYISWKEGYFNLNDTRMDKLLQEISDYYNVKILNECSGELTCSGKLRYDKSVETLLEQISRSIPIRIIKESNYYRVVDRSK